MLLDWFDAKEEAAFGLALAEFIVARLPPDAEAKKATLSDKKRQEVLPKFYAQIEHFRQDRKLNMYKKAKLGNAFRWKMVDAGYATEFIDELTKEVLLRL